VSNVHVGRLIELEVDDLDRLPEMCERLLSNPLIEDYEIVESADADSIGSSAGAELPGAGRPDGADSIGSSAGAELPGAGRAGGGGLPGRRGAL
jgi:hypothetical protein